MVAPIVIPVLAGEQALAATATATAAAGAAVLAGGVIREGVKQYQRHRHDDAGQERAQTTETCREPVPPPPLPSAESTSLEDFSAPPKVLEVPGVAAYVESYLKTQTTPAAFNVRVQPERRFVWLRETEFHVGENGGWQITIPGPWYVQVAAMGLFLGAVSITFTSRIHTHS